MVSTNSNVHFDGFPGSSWTRPLNNYQTFFVEKIQKSNGSKSNIAWRVGYMVSSIFCYHFLRAIAEVGHQKNQDRFRQIKQHRAPKIKLNRELDERLKRGDSVPALDNKLSVADRYTINYHNFKQKYPGKDEGFYKFQAVSQTYDQLSLVSKHVETMFKQSKAEEKENIEAKEKPERQIYLARLQQKVVKQVYNEILPKRIEEGFYNPSIVFDEINLRLKVNNLIPTTISTTEQIERIIHLELQKFYDDRLLKKHQLEHIKKIINPLVKNYQIHFPDKSLEQTLVFCRNLSRALVYQEYYDKGSFSGSDHGSKHVHNNILGAQGLHKTMKEGEDFNGKDQFIESIIHIYHDIGYTVGLATTNFSCSKDHPLIGAKIIEANRQYFINYLDEESYKILHKGVLYHAIVYPNLTPGIDEGNTYNKNMIRAVTTISDACAVTFDRKTQEFWEQPKAILELAKLKYFMMLFPQYADSLGKDEIAYDEWYKLDRENPLDVIAHDFFQKVKINLHDLVNGNKQISSEKKALFAGAIDQQFNGFKANVTLGQYGGVFLDMGAVENSSSVGPKFLPKFTIAPSLIYGVLKDLFGEEQASKWFIAICKEFDIDSKKIQQPINEMYAQKIAEILSDQGGTTDNEGELIQEEGVQVEIRSEDQITPDSAEDAHFQELRSIVLEVFIHLIDVKGIKHEERKKIMDSLERFCSNKADEQDLGNLEIIEKFINSNEDLKNKISDLQQNSYDSEKPSDEHKKIMKEIQSRINYSLMTNEEKKFLGIEEKSLEAVFNGSLG